MIDLVEKARERARIRRKIRGTDDRIADQLDALCNEVERLRAEVAEAKDGWHMANGVADLAMKHRDLAEKENVRLRELVDSDDPAECAAWIKKLKEKQQ